jgi:pyruvate,water dikinase
MNEESKNSEKFILEFEQIRKGDIALVGGKNASLGELIHTLKPNGINVPDGFAITSLAYWEFIYSNKLKEPIKNILEQLDTENFTNLETISYTIRELIRESKIPDEIIKLIKLSYFNLCNKYGKHCDVAVRSSATAEDLPTASFAGQHDSYLNVHGEAGILSAVIHCYASLFSERAIKYRHDKGFDLFNIAQSVGVQKMVRSDMECSGVCFTIDPDTGFSDVIHIAGSWGLGENIVKGNVNPDEFLVFKKTFLQGKEAIIKRKLGSKEKTMVYADNVNSQPEHNIVNVETKKENREIFVLEDEEINQLAEWAILIEKQYGCPMDIEWAKDGLTNELFIVQARPETAHQGIKPFIHKEYKIKDKKPKLTTGIAVGNKIAFGKARILLSSSESLKLQPGEILVTDITNPDWDVVLKRSAGIITNKGGRTSHASIVARELGVPAIVGTNDATNKIKDGQLITISCAEGQTGIVYDGQLSWEEKNYDLRNIEMPRTGVMLIVADPEKAFQLSFYPNSGIGLMRLEFVISNSIQIHPMALAKFDSIKNKKTKEKIEELTYLYEDKKDYFIENLSQAVATIAAAFYPKDVIVRMSDFKTNEYANLIGGDEFEPKEENPMIGFRGASRYYNDRYKEGFRLECEAMKKVRDAMGFTNVKLMIPFCRTVDEAKNVIKQMEEFGLKRGENGLEIYMMVEIPSNVILAEQFSKYFDGFSIGSNDLTQLTLGIDRDSSIISSLFDERNEAAKEMVASVIQKAKNAGIKIGLCGQAPSDFPEYAGFLVKLGIDSISFNPDALLTGIKNINDAEKLKFPLEKITSA